MVNLKFLIPLPDCCQYLDNEYSLLLKLNPYLTRLMYVYINNNKNISLYLQRYYFKCTFVSHQTCLRKKSGFYCFG